MHAPLLATCDPDLLDDLLRLAAAAGVTLDVAHDPASAARLWSSAPVVLVGPDLTSSIAERQPPRRPDVYLLGRGDPDYRGAVLLGASDVVSLPARESWLVDVLADTVDGGGRPGTVVGFVGGCGGVGATTLACATALVSSADRRTALIDLDPLGPGVERVVGIDSADGIRWADLAGSSGRLGARALRDALPRCGDLGVLGWGPVAGPLDGTVVRETLAASRRGHQLVVLDLPRHLTPAAALAASRCDVVVLVAACSLPGAAAAARSLGAMADVGSSLQLIARRADDAVSATDLAATLELTLISSVGEQRRLREQIDLGLGPVHARRGAVARAAAEIVARLVPGSAAA